MQSFAQIVDVNEQNLHQVVEQSMQMPVMFYFWSAQSPHCQEFGATLDKIANDYAGLFMLARVNCDVEQNVAAQFGLRAIPTVYILQEGRPVDGFQGPQPEEVVLEMLSRVLPSPEELKAAQAAELIAEGNLRKRYRYLKKRISLMRKTVISPCY